MPSSESVKKEPTPSKVTSKQKSRFFADIILAVFVGFLRLVLNTFFREIRVRGRYKIPKEGPVLFAVAPHANQFVDPMMLLITAHRQVSFLAAKKSMDKFWIGMFTKIARSIPVQRPQDLAKKGTGSIYLKEENSTTLYGIGTQFKKQVQPRSTISLPNGAGAADVIEVVSDTELVLKKPFSGEAALALLTAKSSDGSGPAGSNYKVTPYVDQSSMFDAVTSGLAAGSAIGIFPEGGSHDRPELLPMKAGVAIMALEAMKAHPDVEVKIVPVGLHYFNADRFRSRAVIEYGDPIVIPKDLAEQYAKGGIDKRAAVGFLLDTVVVNLKALTMNVPDYETLTVMQMARRLYTPLGTKLTIDQAAHLMRRFGEAYVKLQEQKNPKTEELSKKVMEYSQRLKFYGVEDHQVKNMSRSAFWSFCLLIYRSVEIIILNIFSLPIVLMYGPVIFLTRYVSHQKAKEALAGSSVKLRGTDVVATWKLLTSIAVLPLLWTVYTTIAWNVLRFHFGFNLYESFLATCAFAIVNPILGLATVHMSDISNDIYRSLRPLWISLTRSSLSAMELLTMRSELCRLIREQVDELGPQVYPNFAQDRLVKDLKEANSTRSQTVSNDNGGPLRTIRSKASIAALIETTVAPIRNAPKAGSSSSGYLTSLVSSAAALGRSAFLSDWISEYASRKLDTTTPDWLWDDDDKDLIEDGSPVANEGELEHLLFHRHDPSRSS